MTLTLEVFCRSSIFVFEGHFNYIDEDHDNIKTNCAQTP